MRRILQSLAIALIALLSVVVTVPAAAKPNAIQCDAYTPVGICGPLYTPGDKVTIRNTIRFAWLRGTPSSRGPVYYTVYPSTVASLQIINTASSFDGYQNWFLVAPLDNLSHNGWVEQASLIKLDMTTVKPLVANWPIPSQGAIRPGVPFAWIRTQPSSYAYTLSTLFARSVFTIENTPAPSFDGVQWWWPVHFVYPDGTSTVQVDGWVEQNSIMAEAVEPPPVTVILPSPTPSTVSTSFMSAATYQPFEHGFMIWTIWTQTIRIFYTQANEIGFVPLATYGILPANPDTEPIPAGKVRPTLGFGRIWGNYGAVRDMLGWATSPEQGYTATITLPTSKAFGAAGLLSITIPDGRTVTITDAGWQYQ